MKYKSLGFEWCLKSKSCGMGIEFSLYGDRDINFYFALLPFAFYFNIDGFIPKWSEYVEDKEIGWSIHDWTLWVDLWANKNSWSSTDPKWWSFNININPKTLILGEVVYSSELLNEKEVNVPMPEKSYKMNVKLTEDSWTHKRIPLFTKKILRAECDLKEGIPFPGKGTASYNCGEDALYGYSCKASTFEEAIGEVVTTVLTNRRRYPL